MTELPSKYDISSRDLARGRNLKWGAVLAPIVFTALPIIVAFVLFMVFASAPPAAATILFFGFIMTVIGFLTGLVLTGIFAYKYSNWSSEMREFIAADGIKAEELDWFRHELRPNEKRKLKDLTRRDLLLADAYRETLASRLTASRIVKSSKRELLLSQRRQAKIKQLRSENSAKFQDEIKKDVEKLASINTEAKLMLAEAESRLQMIESAALRGSGLADSELALKKLSARSSTLPLALEEAKMAEEIRKELEKEKLD